MGVENAKKEIIQLREQIQKKEQERLKLASHEQEEDVLQITTLQQSIQQAKTELNALQEQSNELWKRQSLMSGGGRAIVEYITQKYDKAKLLVEEVVRNHGYDPASNSLQAILSLIEESISSLEEDVTRLEGERLEALAKISRDEGRLAVLSEGINQLQTSLDTTEAKCKSEFSALQMKYDVSLESFYSYINHLQSQHTVFIISYIQ